MPWRDDLPLSTFLSPPTMWILNQDWVLTFVRMKSLPSPNPSHPRCHCTCPRQPLWMLQTASGLWQRCRRPRRACDSPVSPSETLQPEQRETSPLPAPLIWKPSGSPPPSQHLPLLLSLSEMLPTDPRVHLLRTPVTPHLNAPLPLDSACLSLFSPLSSAQHKAQHARSFVHPVLSWLQRV